MPRVVIVTGSRRWKNKELMVERIVRYASGAQNTILLHGDAKGADQMAGAMGRAYGMMVVPMPANWERDGKSAGSRRNRAMLDVALPLYKHGWEVFAEAFPLPEGSGTQDMIQLCKRLDWVDLHITELGDAAEV